MMATTWLDTDTIQPLIPRWPFAVITDEVLYCTHTTIYLFYLQLFTPSYHSSDLTRIQHQLPHHTNSATKPRAQSHYRASSSQRSVLHHSPAPSIRHLMRDTVSMTSAYGRDLPT